ncbi:uncharacterized protein Triagg1_108 [Trichoderma aggressivum f. europaeum]|uniref:Cupin type-2 domain-containing protein n=1 Tax=Trichoderma aggressivum f. europaeum TaxID=173218 RepID=A0AAE1M750_9HYPO|nr:hypothetical protein Triagg1_108 [Trichoderma aggressivum f. europaeum]
MTSWFPDPRRIVTGHNSEGKAVVVADGTIPCQPTPIGANFAVLFETHEFPVSNDGWEDPTKVRTTDLANKQGIVLRVVDIPPNVDKAGMLFHRTESLDFGILFSGEVICHLEDGVEIHMKPGDVCVQRGTIHGWTNSTDKPARLYFILSAAKPVNVNGQSLTAAGYSKHEVESGGEIKK